MALRASIWLVIGRSFRLAALAGCAGGVHVRLPIRSPSAILPGAVRFCRRFASLIVRRRPAGGGRPGSGSAAANPAQDAVVAALPQRADLAEAGRTQRLDVRRKPARGGPVVLGVQLEALAPGGQPGQIGVRGDLLPPPGPRLPMTLREAPLLFAGDQRL